MKVKFDTNIKVAGVGIAPWPRLGPEKWLPHYKIASYFGWDVQNNAAVPEHFSIKEIDPTTVLEKLNTPMMLENKVFQSILTNKLPGYAFLTYKTVAIPKPLQDRNFLMVDVSFSEEFENKVVFRELFDKKMKFPAYSVYERGDLVGSQKEYEKIAAGRPVFVLQDEQLSGGKGTFIISSYDEYTSTLCALKVTSIHKKVVVSDAIENPRERSIQACVTQFGVVTGPLQRQIVRHPLLANMEVPTGDKWCGIQVYASDQNTDLHIEAQHAAQEVGKVLADRGYRGIFGLDFLLSEDEQLFLIEANPRITGATPLLAALFNDESTIPFYLLHILELGRFDYAIDNFSAQFNKDGALLVFHSLEKHDVLVRNKPQSGTYRIVNSSLERVSGNLDINDLNEGEWILQEYTNRKMVARPGMRILTAQTATGVIDKKSDKLYNRAIEDIQAIYNSMTMEKYTA